MLNRFDFSRPRAVLGWTVLLGVVAGLVAASYFSVAAEPVIDDAIAIEDAVAATEDAGDGHHEDDAQVSRGTQRGVGLFGAYALTGAALGLLLAVAAMALRGSWLTPFRRFLTAGVILAGAIHLAPWLKYPPNPPAVGDEGTVTERTVAYLLLIALTVLVLAGAAHLSSRLRRAGWEDPARIAGVALVAAVGVAVVLIAMPTNTVEISSEFSEAALTEGMSPASVVWRFRTVSLVGDLLLWGVLTMAAAFAFSPSKAPATVADPATPEPSASPASGTNPHPA